MPPVRNDPLQPSAELLMALGSALIHADEYMSDHGHPTDLASFRTLMEQPIVQDWIRDMGPLLPVRR